MLDSSDVYGWGISCYHVMPNMISMQLKLKVYKMKLLCISIRNCIQVERYKYMIAIIKIKK